MVWSVPMSTNAPVCDDVMKEPVSIVEPPLIISVLPVIRGTIPPCPDTSIAPEILRPET